jgi:hypothetical protein
VCFGRFLPDERATMRRPGSLSSLKGERDSPSNWVMRGGAACYGCRSDEHRDRLQDHGVFFAHRAAAAGSTCDHRRTASAAT